jgi:hypothetical protein
MARGLHAVLLARIALGRAGAGALAAGVCLLLAAAMWFALLPGLAARTGDEAHALARARLAPPKKPAASPEAQASERLAAFYAALGDDAHTEEVVIRLFQAAAETGVVLDKAEYKPARDTVGRFETYTIILPVKGDYARLRRFCEQVLLAVPYASLDDMRFKRGSANEQGVEASLRFTVFLRPGVGATNAAARGTREERP